MMLRKPKFTKFVDNFIINMKILFGILDDEFYFILTSSGINGNDNFYSSSVDLTPNNVKLKIKDKFENKLLAISLTYPFEISRSYITRPGVEINGQLFS